ncbi:hypothetical protein POM88_034093 [Heracleum sosnowskyi]|uniref:Transposase-associated domain-containing protein n=1 Tax=Heracleum sosnowskyi TaxID=360622 RepID=A0AAD8HIV5_9APIA|nr:hypothetical protein POM88_034093 [Heracleum sosnowskyi]
MSLDRSWINQRFHVGTNCYTREFLNGVDEFIKFAKRHCEEDDEEIRCPCCRCCNVPLKSFEEVRFDILTYGFCEYYTFWDVHGEGAIERSRKRRRRREDDESGASTDGRSLHMADEFVIQAVDQTVAYARAHANEFRLAPEQVCMLEKSVSVAEGNGELPADHPMSMGTMTELVQVMVSVLADIQACQKHDGNNGNGKSVMRTG